ncbi:zinc-binding dehydrogenase [Pseudomonas gingeri]|uniref:zinc-binding dehydrogenase n=1 Tax=Pseudomonas gingeri TaxID=117681 RepID=UPI003526FCD4
MGHLAVQYARHMGFEVVAIARGQEKGELAKSLGAHHYLDSEKGGLAEALQDLGGATVVFSIASSGQAVADVVKGLAPGGHFSRLEPTQTLSQPQQMILFLAGGQSPAYSQGVR